MKRFCIFDVLISINLNLNRMSDFKERLEIEKSELSEKLDKLNNFNQSEKANEIDPVQKDLLHIQAGAMYTYLRCLEIRLERL